MNPDTTLSATLLQLEEQLLQPHIRKSPSEVAALLADEFIEFGSSGRIYDRQQTIQALQNESDDKIGRRSLTDFATSVLATGVVLVTYQAFRFDPSGKQIARSLRSSIWKLIEGRWQLIFHQGTPISFTGSK